MDVLIQLVPHHNLPQCNDAGMLRRHESLNFPQAGNWETLVVVHYLKLLESHNLPGGNLLSSRDPSIRTLFDVIELLEIVDMPAGAPFRGRES